MITALDTNVLLDILRPNEEFVRQATEALETAAVSGALGICEVVYAASSVHFPDQRSCDAFLEKAGIRVEPVSREAGFLAGRVWRAYRKAGGLRTRILPDFLIGAHAQLRATQFLSRDRGFYGSSFPKLAIVDPSTAKGHRSVPSSTA